MFKGTRAQSLEKVGVATLPGVEFSDGADVWGLPGTAASGVARPVETMSCSCFNLPRECMMLQLDIREHGASRFHAGLRV